MQKPKYPWLRMVCYYPFALGLAASGLVLIVMGIDIPGVLPVGLLCLALCGAPYAWWHSRWIKATVAWNHRDDEVKEENVAVEWSEEEIDEAMMDIALNMKGRGK